MVVIREDFIDCVRLLVRTLSGDLLFCRTEYIGEEISEIRNAFLKLRI